MQAHPGGADRPASDRGPDDQHPRRNAPRPDPGGPPPQADRWAVTEAPASCCVRLHIGELELMYTMRDVSDAELTRRVQHLTPWVQDLVDQARERQHQLDTCRQQRDAAAGQAAVPPPPPSVPPVSPPTNVQALIQQAVKQTLAAQAAASKDQPAAAPRQPSELLRLPARTAGARVTRWPWSAAAMRRARGGATGWRTRSAGVAASSDGGRRVDARCPLLGKHSRRTKPLSRA